MSRNTFWGILAALVGLSAVLRITGIDHQSFWIDEIASLSMAQDELTGDFSRLRSDVHPPLYFLLLGLWTDIFGSSEAAVRMLSVLPSLAAVVVLARLGARLYGARAGLFAAGLASVSLLQIYYAQEGRSYAWLMLFGLLSSDALVRWRMRGQPGSAVAYAGWTTALLYTHYFGFLLLAAQALYVTGLLLPKGNRNQPGAISPRRTVAGWSLAILAIGILFLPWLSVLLDQVESVRQGFWIEAPTLMSLFRVPLLFLSIVGPWTIPESEAPQSAPFIVLAFALMTLLLWALLAWSRSRHPAHGGLGPTSERLPPHEATRLLWLWLLLPPIASFAVSGFGLDIFTYRNTVISSPALLLLLAGGARRLANPLALGVLLAALVAPSVGQLPGYYGQLHKDPWREVSRHLTASFDPQKDALAFDAPFVQRSFDHYSSLAPYREVDLFGSSPSGVNRIWLIRAYAGPQSRSPEFIESWGFLSQERSDFLHLELHRFERTPERE